jgi:anthranilate synthase component 2
VCAWADAPDGGREIMAVKHRQYELHGLQFHPESFLTQCGTELLRRFIELESAATASAAAGAEARSG